MPVGPFPSRLPIVLLFDEGSESGWLQPLAGEIVWCDRPLSPDATPAVARPLQEPAYDREWASIYDGPGLLAGGVERIRAARGDLGSYRITHADGENFHVAGDGGLICRQASHSKKVDLDISRALGAPLALALALRGTYLLHASALARRDGAVLALSAESGGGKSTLAAAAARFPDLALTRIADDQLPVQLGRSSVALPHFPQLKLQAGDLYPSGSPASLRLGALVEIETDGSIAASELVRQPSSTAIRSLVGATVASKLFDGELLARHFDACATAALALPVYRLRYPWGLDRFAEALAVLARLPA